MNFDKDEVPLHFETARLRPAIKGGGWLISTILIAVGIGLAVTADHWGIEAVGVAAAGVGGVLLTGLVRCSRYEIVVNRRFITGGAGPLRNRLPVGLVEHADMRSAARWRRLYSDREAVFHGPDRVQTVILPSRDPEALIDAVRTASGSSPLIR